ncbi:MAG: hypothetical protein R3F49_14765 [Planctomycetota bacterium]
MLASLMAVFVIAGLGAYVVQVQSAFARRQCSAIDKKRALYVAEAGLAEAVLAVSQGRSGELGSEDVPVRFHDGVYWVESESINDGRRVLTSRGRVGIGAFTVRLQVLPNVNPVGNVGFFGDEGVLIGDAVILDGFDSRDGSYDAQTVTGFGFPTTGADALVQSNADIVLDDAATWPLGTPDPYLVHVKGLPTEIQAQLLALDPTCAERLALSAANLVPLYSYILGALRAGVDHTVQTNGNTKILTLTPSENEVLLPDVIEPITRLDVETMDIVLVGKKDVNQVSGRTKKIEVKKGGSLELHGPAVLHVDELKVKKGGVVILDDSSGPIHLHIGKKLKFEAGSLLISSNLDVASRGCYISIPPPADPKNDDDVELKCSGVFRGILYAPGHRITLPTGLRYFGAASAKHLSIADGAWVTFDKAFRHDGVGVPILPRQNSWEIIQEEPRAALKIGFDPLADLRRRGIEPKTPANASPEAIAHAAYLDANGLLQSFDGVLDQTQIGAMDRVISLRWLDPVTDSYGEPLRPSGMDPDDTIEAYRAQVRAAR